ncbi:MAG: hypothetical protein WCE64_09325 [Bacteroidales bacterium]
MANKPLTLPVQKKEVLTTSAEWGNLKSRFSGKTLFRTNLYHLITGNLSVLDNISNKWFFSELFEYSRITHDINMLPVLGKITANSGLSESLRQKASEAAETIEEWPPSGTRAGVSSEQEKALEARKILAGARFPQTTEILRLLRDKSIIIKRLALFLIAKFKLADMSQEVCECLNIPGLEEDAINALEALGSSAIKEINRFYLRSSGNINTSIAVLRLFSRTCPKENMSFLVERLGSNSRQIREVGACALVKCGYGPNDQEREHLHDIIFGVFETLTWINSGKITLEMNNEPRLLKEMDKEYNRWKDYLLNLLHIVYGQGDNAASKAGHDLVSKAIPELTQLIFGNSSNHGKENMSRAIAEKRINKKLQHYFPMDIPGYRDLLEDIINCDYNLLGIWTKSSALRIVPGIETRELGESVAALLFSPEEILREEATRLMARSGISLYKTTSDRIPESSKRKLDGIISGETDSNELLYEKTRFLASCFDRIIEDELLVLAESLEFSRDLRGIPERADDGSIIWTVGPGKEMSVKVIYKDSGRREHTEPKGESFFYELPLSAVREFNTMYPGSSFGLFGYIDEHEE